MTARDDKRGAEPVRDVTLEKLNALHAIFRDNSRSDYHKAIEEFSRRVAISWENIAARCALAPESAPSHARLSDGPQDLTPEPGYSPAYGGSGPRNTTLPETTPSTTRRCTCFVLPHADDCGLFMGITQSGGRVYASETPRTDEFESRIVSGDEHHAPLVKPLTNVIDYCAAYGEAIEEMARMEVELADALAKAKEAETTASATPCSAEIERAWQMLEICGVPRERARNNLARGIEVLSSRLAKEEWFQKAMEGDAERHRFCMKNGFPKACYNPEREVHYFYIRADVGMEESFGWDSPEKAIDGTMALMNRADGGKA